MNVLKPERCPVCGAVPKRNSEQNSAYWALLHKISLLVKPAGVSYDSKSWHLYFREKLLGYVDTVLPSGKQVTSLRSTTDLDKQEFSDYLAQVEAFAAERNVFRDE